MSKTVLHIDDDDLVRKLVKKVLEGLNYRYLGVDNAEEGIALAHKEKPDLILMDIRLPEMDGLTATRMIRKDPQIGEIPILAFTAHAMKEDREEAVEAGCNGYISKPIDVKLFADTINSFLAR